MAKKKKNANHIFNSLRKRIAPHSFKLKNKKKSARADAVGRKHKHKGEQDERENKMQYLQGID